MRHQAQDQAGFVGHAGNRARRAIGVFRIIHRGLSALWSRNGKPRVARKWTAAPNRARPSRWAEGILRTCPARPSVHAHFCAETSSLTLRSSNLRGLIFEKRHAPLAGVRPGKIPASASTWNPLQTAEQRLFCRQESRQLVAQPGHQHGRENPSGAQVISIRKSTRDDRRLKVIEPIATVDQVFQQHEFASCPLRIQSRQPFLRGNSFPENKGWRSVPRLISRPR